MLLANAFFLHVNRRSTLCLRILLIPPEPFGTSAGCYFCPSVWKSFAGSKCNRCREHGSHWAWAVAAKGVRSWVVVPACFHMLLHPRGRRHNFNGSDRPCGPHGVRHYEAQGTVHPSTSFSSRQLRILGLVCLQERDPKAWISCLDGSPHSCSGSIHSQPRHLLRYLS